MSKEELIEMEGEIIEAHRGGIFKVVTADEIEVNCRPSGKIRINNINLVVGDMVEIEVSPYDPSVGRIVTRL